MTRIDAWPAGTLTTALFAMVVVVTGTGVSPVESDTSDRRAEPADARAGSAPAEASTKKRDGIPLEAVERMVREIKVYAVADGDRSQLRLREEPLLRHFDITQQYSDGTMWVWGGEGRPHAVLTLSILGRNTWVHEFISLSTNGVEANVGQGPPWSPKKPGWNPQPFSDAPVPAKTDRVRLSQMKELARRFTAFEYYTDLYHPGQRYELRLMPQPVYRYGKPDGGPLDGAFFVIAKDTNPEILLVIELQAPGNTARAWQYNCSRVTVAGLSLALDGQEVWKQEPRHFRSTTVSDPYWIYESPVAPMR
jgi:hypothetical protein